jgi:DNA-binding NarL/FixJ family response regulator
MIRILVVDNHPLLRETVCRALEAAIPEASAHEAGSVPEACKMTEQPFGLILLEPWLPGGLGLESVRTIRSHFPNAPLLLFTAVEDAAWAAEVLALGAAGIVPKSASKASLLEATRAVLHGKVFARPRATAYKSSASPESAVHKDMMIRLHSLSRCEAGVMRLVRQGKLNKQIAHELGICERTVKAHVSAILRKLKVVSRTQLVIATSAFDLEAMLAPGTGRGFGAVL